MIDVQNAAVEALALTILNSDREMSGLPPVASRATIPNSEGYVVNAEAVLASMANQEAIDVAHLRHVIDRDRYIVAAGTSAIQNVIRGRAWLFEGRGPYEWDDDDYRKEFGAVLADIDKVMDPLRRVAWDKSDCANIEARVMAAKLAAGELVKQPLGHRDMIDADIGLPDMRDTEIAMLRRRVDELTQSTSNEARLPNALTGHWETPDPEMLEDYAKRDRSDLAHGDMTDFALANRQFMAGRTDLDLIAWQTAAKERIRWLSVQLALRASHASEA